MENLGACWSEDGPRGTSADRQEGTRIRPCTLEGNQMQTPAATVAEHASAQPRRGADSPSASARSHSHGRANEIGERSITPWPFAFGAASA